MKEYKIDFVDIEFFSGGMVIYWEDLNGFFGNVTVTKKTDGSIYIDDEYMSKEFVKAVFDALIEKWYK